MLSRVPRVSDKNVLVGFDTADDAGVYRLTPECALVQTVDFFTPILDDPYLFGAIAAANSLSDVYAMGARPLTALSIVAFPGKGDVDDLEEILKGGSEKMREAGCVVIGGHSIADDEVKFGYAVTGLVHPGKVKTNAGAQVGDSLVFTKRLGTGIVATALKRGIAAPEHVQASIDSMLQLNARAWEALHDLEVHAMTDITGFGLIGHAREMAQASNATLEIESGTARWLPGALEYSRQGAIPAGLKNNREFASCAVEITRPLAHEVENLLYDPQTSGGLLVALPDAAAEVFLARYPEAYRIGRVKERDTKSIIVT